MRRFSILSFALFIAAVFSVAAYSYPHKHGMGHKDWWDNDQYVKELNLTDEQVTSINDIDKSYDSKFESLHEQLMKSYEAYKVSMYDPAATDKQITEKHNEMLTKKMELKKLKLEKKLRIRSVLNNEQIAKMGEMKKQHRSRDCDHKDKKCDGDCAKECDMKKEGKECDYKSKK